MTKTTLRAGHRVIVYNSDWYDGNCNENDNHDNDHRKGEGSVDADNRASGNGGGRDGRGQRLQQWQQRWQTTINNKQQKMGWRR
jgi:hypothetical protein